MLRRLLLIISLALPFAVAQPQPVLPPPGGGTAGGIGGAGIGFPPRRADPTQPGQQAASQQPEKPQTPGSIEGSVTNATTGEPLKRAAVLVIPMRPGPNAPPLMTMTDANGQFTIGNIPPGQYRVMAERNGYVVSNYGSTGPTQPARTLTIGPGQTLKEIAVRMHPHGVIAGRVLDEDGEPLAHVQLQSLSPRYVQGRKQMIPTSGAGTNDLGEYRIFGLAPGKYVIVATVGQFGMAGGMNAAITGAPIEDEGYGSTYYPAASEVTSAVPVEVQAGQPVTNIDFKLRRVRTVRVKGKVSGAQQQIGRSMVSLWREGEGMRGGRTNTSTYGPDGAFEIRGVTPGTYMLVAQQMDQNQQLTARTSITVGNANVENVELVLRPATPVTGVVRMEGDTPGNLGQIMVSLQPKQFGPFSSGGSAPVSPDGTFTIPNISANSYIVTANLRGTQAVYLKAVQAGPQELPDRELTITEGGAPILTLVVSTAAAQLAGQVIAEKPAQGATVALIPPADKLHRMDLYRSATTDQYGKYSLPGIPPGEYTLYAWDQVEPGSWMDPEFLAKFQNKGKKIVLKEKESVTVDAPLLPAGDTQ